MFPYFYKPVRVESVDIQGRSPLGVSTGRLSDLSSLLLSLREPSSGTTMSASSQGREKRK